MFHIELSRKNLFALLLGFLLIVGIGIVTSAISFFMVSNVMRTVPASEFKSALSEQPIITFNWLLRIISFVSPILGGLVVGYIVKEKGWLYGGLLGIILLIISIAIVSLTLILPTSMTYDPQFPSGYGHDLALKNILNQLLHSPLTIALTALGGLLGEKFYKKR